MLRLDILGILVIVRPGLSVEKTTTGGLHPNAGHARDSHGPVCLGARNQPFGRPGAITANPRSAACACRRSYVRNSLSPNSIAATRWMASAVRRNVLSGDVGHWPRSCVSNCSAGTCADTGFGRASRSNPVPRRKRPAAVSRLWLSDPPGTRTAAGTPLLVTRTDSPSVTLLVGGSR